MKASNYKVGLIGCGNISDAYIKGCRLFDILEVVAVSDLAVERAQAKAAEHQVPKAYSVKDLLADPEVDIVVNLTFPTVHAEVSFQALSAGKHVYSEKPLATTREDGKKLLETAQAQGVRLGCAPDTFLGGGLQTCRKALDDGLIGEPLSATAFLLSRGVESWHPNPGFFFQAGGQPLFDMGPYYLTALVSFLGPISAVVGSMSIGVPERIVTSEPLAGTVIQVEAPTHTMALLEFETGKVANLIVSGEVWASHHSQRIEIYGTEGTLAVPDPNTFNGPVFVKRAGDKTWQELPLSHPYTSNSRGLGVADMAHSLSSGRPQRASGELAYHVLDTMVAIDESALARRYLAVESRCERPAPLPLGLRVGSLDG